jgi:TatD DNase family protein
MDLIDIGLNLSHSSFAQDRDDVVMRAEAVGVRHMVLTGSDLAESRTVSQMASDEPARYSCTAGVHPHLAKGWDQDTAAGLMALYELEGVRAVGECGLDYNRNYSPPDSQRLAFAAQLELAADIGLPVFLHQRDAHVDFLAIYDEHRSALSGPGVAHCFTGSAEELDDYLARDLYVGITGWICDERRGHHLKEIVGRIPADRILLETDAPYLLPRDLEPKPETRRNEPMHLAHICQVVATARAESSSTLAAATTENAQRFFGLPDEILQGTLGG